MSEPLIALPKTSSGVDSPILPKTNESDLLLAPATAAPPELYSPSSQLSSKLERLTAKLAEIPKDELSVEQMKALAMDELALLKPNYYLIASDSSIGWIRHPQGYEYAPRFRKPQLEAMLLRIPVGCQTSIHHHLDSLNVGVVLSGKLTARLFDDKGELIEEETLAVGEFATTERFPQSHQLANGSQETEVTVLALYSDARPE